MPERILIADARNLGPISAAEFEVLGIRYLDEIISLGWEETCIQYVEAHPHRLNLNAFTAIIGAIENQDWRRVDPVLKAQAKRLLKSLKASI